METKLIRILPACLTEALPQGWDVAPPEYKIEVMPEVERPEVVALAVNTTDSDILLLDGDFPDLDPFAVTEETLAARPGLAVIIVSSNSAPDRLHRAMLSGVEEYLIKPLEPLQLRDSIIAIASHRTLRLIHEEEYTPEGSESAGRVVGVVSGIGGLGKTTLAVNLATLVAQAPRQTASLVGLESGDGAVLLSLEPRMGLLDLAHAVSADDSAYTEDWLKQFGNVHRNGLSYWTWQGTATRVGAVIPEDFFPKLFNTFRRMSSVTVVDFPLLAEEEIAGVLPLLDIILLVSSTSDLLALRSTKSFFDAIPGEHTDKVRLVINRSDPTDMISREDFESALGQRVAAVVPNEALLAAQAINMGSPFVLTQPQSEITRQLRDLGHRLFDVPLAETTAKAKKRFMIF